MKKIKTVFDWGLEFVYLVRYSASGVFNTIVGLSVIFLASGLGAAPELANAMGYAVGFLVSFTLNKKVVFQSDGDFLVEAGKYIAAFVVAFLMNILVLKLLLYLNVNIYFSQMVAIGCFTVLMYIFTRFFVFKN